MIRLRAAVLRRSVLFLPLASLLPSSPDVLPPGHRPVCHELVLVWSDEVERAWQFVAAPTSGFHGVTAIRRGEPFRFSSKYGTRIHALPVGAPLPSDVGEWTRQHPSAAPPVHEERSAPVWSTVALVRTTVRVHAIDATGIGMQVEREERFGAMGEALTLARPWPLLGAVAALGALGLAWTRRRHRRSARVVG